MTKPTTKTAKPEIPSRRGSARIEELQKAAVVAKEQAKADAAAAPKKATPKKASPKKATPKKTQQKKASPSRKRKSPTPSSSSAGEDDEATFSTHDTDTDIDSDPEPLAKKPKVKVRDYLPLGIHDEDAAANMAAHIARFIATCHADQLTQAFHRSALPYLDLLRPLLDFQREVASGGDADRHRDAVLNIVVALRARFGTDAAAASAEEERDSMAESVE